MASATDLGPFPLARTDRLYLIYLAMVSFWISRGGWHKVRGNCPGAVPAKTGGAYVNKLEAADT